MLRSLGQNPTDSEVNDMINELDVEGSGLIEFNQFAKFVIKLDMAEGDQEEETLQMFRRWPHLVAGTEEFWMSYN